MALTKADMAERLFEELGINKREAKELVEIFFEEIRGALERGRQVKLSGFGNSICATKISDRGAIPKLEKKSRSPRAAWSRFDRARSSRREWMNSMASRSSSRSPMELLGKLGGLI
jgi:nucleoid DNA-binding protein